MVHLVEVTGFGRRVWSCKRVRAHNIHASASARCLPPTPLSKVSIISYVARGIAAPPSPPLPPSSPFPRSPHLSLRELHSTPWKRDMSALFTPPLILLPRSPHLSLRKFHSTPWKVITQGHQCLIRSSPEAHLPQIQPAGEQERLKCAIGLPQALVRKHTPGAQRHWCPWSKPVNVETWGHVSGPIVMAHAWEELLNVAEWHASTKTVSNMGHIISLTVTPRKAPYISPAIFKKLISYKITTSTAFN